MAKASLHSPPWQTLKGLLKKSSTLLSVVYRLRGIRFVDNLQDLDRLLQDISERHPLFGHAAITESSKICYRFRNLDLPKDETSGDYARRQLEIYEYFSGRKAPDLKNKSERDPGREGDNSRSGSQSEYSSWEAERQSIMSETILRAMNLPKGSKVVELGAGCGDVTLALAKAGYEVTAVEIDTSYAGQTESRTKHSVGKVTVVNQDMLEFVRNSSDTYDAALFVGSFHHCLEHVDLLRNLSERIQQKGIICFANEPVFLAENPFLPYPWGVRLDGQSLYFMRKYGWLELGFQDSYFRRILSQFGWRMEGGPSGSKTYPDTIIARRRHS